MDIGETVDVLQQVLGRSSDFVGGIDNEALDFSQLEDFINDENDASNTYFADTLAHNEPHATGVATVGGAPILVVVQGEAPAGSPARLVTKANTMAQNYNHPHSLPESPPDSGSEPPYSPQDPATQTPHQKGPVLHPELLLNPLPLLHASAHQQQHPLYPAGPHLKPVMVAGGGDNLLSHQTPVLTPLLTQRAIQQQDLQAMGLGSSPSSLAIAAVHAECPQGITTIYTSLPSGTKKRKLSQDGGQPTVHVKQEPELSPDSSSNQTAALDDEYFDLQGESGLYMDSSFQCIRFQPFQQTSWHVLCDHNLKELPAPHYRVDADKGFNFSTADDAFVCQKKNHFQITCHAQLQGDAHFVRTADGLVKVASFHLHFYGVKVESPAQTIKVEQSQSDRSKKPFHPVLCPHVSRVDLAGEQVTKVTVGRLHFSETTSNNMRKKGKPNPDQRYFHLVVGLHAHCADSSHYPVVAHASERIIVRASNPGQFESDVELCWQKGHTPESIFHAGRVGINTDRPDEAMVIHGNLKVTGHIVQPSDSRAKDLIEECDSREQLRNVSQLRVVRYQYAAEFATHAGLGPVTARDTGLIAQEVQAVLPDAVRPSGDIVLPSGRRIDNFLVVNKDRIFMENVGAVKELCKVTDNLETRIDELERMNRKMAGLRRFDSVKSHGSYSTVSSKLSGESASSKSSHSHRKSKEGGLCSTKNMQIAITMLVLVMAMCLIAMATLYFVEVGKKNEKEYDSVSYSQRVGSKRPLFTTSRPPAYNGSVVAKGTNHHGNEISQDTWYSRRPVTSKHNLPVTQGLPTRPQPDVLSPEETESLDHALPALRLAPPVLGRPKECTPKAQYLEGETIPICQIYCCQSEAMHLEDNQEHEEAPSSDTNIVSRTTRQHGNGVATSSPALPEVNPLQVGDGNIVVRAKHASNNKSKKATVRRRRRQSDDWIESDNIFSNHDPEQGVVMEVRGEGFNQTVGQEFCVERTSSNSSYVIALSKYLPDESVSLHFQFPRLWQWSQPCHSPAPPAECPAPHGRARAPGDWEEGHQAHNGTEEEWGEAGPHQVTGDHGASFTVDVGAFARVTLRYRVPLLQSVTNICYLPKTKLGIDYLEYNLVLYRACDD